MLAFWYWHLMNPYLHMIRRLMVSSTSIVRRRTACCGFLSWIWLSVVGLAFGQTRNLAFSGKQLFKLHFFWDGRMPGGIFFGWAFICCVDSGFENMGACISTSSQRTCGSDSKGDGSSSSCLPIQLCSRKSKRTYTDHIATLKHLSSIPNRVFMNGKSQSSCLFTRQGRKGINQDAMIVWEVSFFFFLFLFWSLLNLQPFVGSFLLTLLCICL